LLAKTPNPEESELRACWYNADQFLMLGRPKKETNEQIQTTQ